MKLISLPPRWMRPALGTLANVGIGCVLGVLALLGGALGYWPLAWARLLDRPVSGVSEP